MYTMLRAFSVLVGLTGLIGTGASLAEPIVNWRDQWVHRTFDPDHASYPSRADGKSRWRVIGQNPFLVSYDSSSNGEKIIELSWDISQIAQVNFAHNKVVFFGWTNKEFVTKICIFDYESGQRLDEFLSYEPVLSPDNQKIAFRRFYPPHFISGPDDQYYVYILAWSGITNRPSTPSDGRLSEWSAGFPIYPVREGEVKRDNFDVAENIAHIARTTFFWSDDSRLVAFIDEQSSKTKVLVADTSSFSSTRLVALKSALLPNACSARNLNVERCQVIDGGEKIVYRKQGLTIVSEDEKRSMYDLDWSAFQSESAAALKK